MNNSYRPIPPALSALLTMLFIYGCASRPEEQIARTESAMQQAMAEHASHFAPADWQSADEAWRSAQEMLDQGSYREANTLLLRAKTRFEKARDIAKGKREEAIREITGIQKTVELRFQALKENVDKNRAKLSASNIKSLDEVMKNIEENMAKSSRQLDEELYQEARFSAQTTLRQVWETEKELEEYLGGKKRSS